MAGTVLFFGDSNTRGYGVGRERRYAALVEAALRRVGFDDWRFATASTESDFRLIPRRFERALAEERPDVVVWQLPTGPATYFVQYPSWFEQVRNLSDKVEQWGQRRAIDREVAETHGDRTERDSGYEGLWLHRTQALHPRTWLGGRWVRATLARRYGLDVKVTLDRYLHHVDGVLDQIAAVAPKAVVLHGLIRHSDHRYPGWSDRALEWTTALGLRLHQPDEHRHFIDTLHPLMGPPEREVLLSDGTHMTPGGHEVLAGLLLAELPTVLRAASDADSVEA